MIFTYKLFAIGFHLSILLYKANSFILFTANVEDLRRIAQKFVSDSFADKLARFIIAATDNDKANIADGADTSNEAKRHTNIIAVKKTWPKYDGTALKRRDLQSVQSKSPSTTKTTLTTRMSPNKAERNKLTTKRNKIVKKNMAERVNTINEESLESDDLTNAKLIIDLEKIDSDESSMSRRSRKEFQKIPEVKKDTNKQRPLDHKEYGSRNKSNTKNNMVHKNEEPLKIKAKGKLSEDESDFNDSNKLDTVSEELTSNLTTEKQMTDFDQYINTDYPKAKVVATSGPVELTNLRVTKYEDSSDSEDFSK